MKVLLKTTLFFKNRKRNNYTWQYWRLFSSHTTSISVLLKSGLVQLICEVRRFNAQFLFKFFCEVHFFRFIFCGLFIWLTQMWRNTTFSRHMFFRSTYVTYSHTLLGFIHLGLFTLGMLFRSNLFVRSSPFGVVSFSKFIIESTTTMPIRLTFRA